MENIMTQIEQKCHEKLMIYHDLLTIFRKERKSIVNADVTALWRFSSEKQKLANGIEKIRAEIIEILENHELVHGMTEKTFQLEKMVGFFSGADGHALMDHLITINRVKNQIEIAGNANRLFIEEYLATIGELVNVVTGNNTKSHVYNQSRQYNKTRDQETVIISREV